PRRGVTDSIKSNSSNSRISLTAFCFAQPRYSITCSKLKWIYTFPSVSAHLFFLDSPIRSSIRPYRTLLPVDSPSNLPSHSAFGTLYTVCCSSLSFAKYLYSYVMLSSIFSFFYLLSPIRRSASGFLYCPLITSAGLISVPVSFLLSFLSVLQSFFL